MSKGDRGSSPSRRKITPVMQTPVIKHLGLVPYEATWRAMQDFTTARSAATRDELWVLEHPPVYTVGLAGRPEHFPKTGTIPLVRADRGGQITYHAPGQAIVYALIDLVRAGIKVRDMVCVLEQAAIDLLAEHGVTAGRKDGAPGVYVAGAKIAALGLKVKRGGCYHGISLNVAMDLAPFSAIDPCGYPDLAVTSLEQLGVRTSTKDIGQALAERIATAVNTARAKCRAEEKAKKESHVVPV